MKSYVKFAFELYKNTLRGNLTFAYQGEFDTKITDKLLALTEKNLHYLGEKKVVKKKVFNIMVECLQNICKHQSEEHEQLSNTAGVFIVRKLKDKYYISSGNPVAEKDVKKLKSKLDKVNDLGKEELKKLYTEVLMEESLSEKGGAGLGLIDIARKSGERLKYHFEPIVDNVAYYYLQTQLKTSENGNEEVKEETLKETLRFHEVMRSRHLLLFYVGEFDQRAVINVLSMAEANIKSTGKANKLRKNVFSVMVEVLQNICQHGKMTKVNGVNASGVFLIAEDEGNYIVSTGNLIDRSDVKSLKERISHINNLSTQDLDEFYDREVEKERDDVDADRARLGLIDLAMRSNENLKFDFRDLDETENKFFFLQVSV